MQLLIPSPSFGDGTNGAVIDHLFAVSSSTALAPLGLVTAGNGTGAATATIVPPDASAFGVQQSQTGTTTTGRHGIWHSAASYLFGSVQMSVEWRFQIPTLLDGTESGAIYIGFGDNISGAPVDGAFLYWDNTQTNFRYRTRANNVQTDVDSGLAPVAATWYTIRAKVDAAAANAIFTINGANAQTIATNIPTGAGRETTILANIIKSAGTTSRSIYLDYCRLGWGNGA